jgi:hypothetical protein
MNCVNFSGSREINKEYHAFSFLRKINYCRVIGLFFIFSAFFSITILNVNAADDFCPAEPVKSLNILYHRCNDYNDQAACAKYEEERCCLCECYPGCCGGESMMCSAYYEGYCKCSGSSDTNGDIPWVVVIGAIGALGVAAVAGAKVLGKKSPAPQKPSTTREKEKEKKKPVQYILQFLPESLAKTAVAGVVHLQAGPGGTASFTVIVKKKLQDGTITSAPEAQISIAPTPGTTGIMVTPSRGNGQVSCTVSVDKSVTDETGELVVSVTGAGSGFSTNVIVDIEQNYRVEFE